MKILIIEDEPDMAELLTATLRPAGYQLRLERSGDEIERVLVEYDPQVVIIDILLFGSQVDGYEVIRRIRAASGHKETLVIVLTALADKQYQKRAFEAGANIYMIKPFSPLKLLNEIRSAEIITD